MFLTIILLALTAGKAVNCLKDSDPHAYYFTFISANEVSIKTQCDFLGLVAHASPWEDLPAHCQYLVLLPVSLGNIFSFFSPILTFPKTCHDVFHEASTNKTNKISKLFCLLVCVLKRSYISNIYTPVFLALISYSRPYVNGLVRGLIYWDVVETPRGALKAIVRPRVLPLSFLDTKW